MARNLRVTVQTPLRPRGVAGAAWGGWLPLLATGAFALLIWLPAAAATHYPGSVAFLIVFEISFTLMLLLAAPRPRSYAYTFVVVFLFLGFWLKFNLHTLLEYPYQEPVGAFDGTAASWDSALVMASLGALGVSLARLVQLAWHRRPQRLGSPQAIEPRQPSVPSWFATCRKAIWLATAAAVIVLNVANLVAAFYAIGVDPRVVLPAHANVVIAWLLKLGLALWIATLVQWELQRSGSRAADAVLLAPVGEALGTSISALSRGIFLFHVLPYTLVALSRRTRLLRGLGRRRVAILAAVTAVGFFLSLGAVSLLRVLQYPTAAPAQNVRTITEPRRAVPAAPADRPRARTGADTATSASRGDTSSERLDSRRLFFVFRELRGLVVERWNGMEGVMAVSSHDRLGPDLLLEAVKENPARAQLSIYQKLANADRVYVRSQGYTFLTLPGIIAILGYSGSPVLMLVGMVLVTGIMLGLEGLIRQILANPFVTSVAGLAMASELSQANFPYLLFTFFVLLTLSLSALCVVTHGRRGHLARFRAIRPT